MHLKYSICCHELKQLKNYDFFHNKGHAGEKRKEETFLLIYFNWIPSGKSGMDVFVRWQSPASLTK